MNLSTLGTVLTALAGLSGLGSLLLVWQQGRKLKADATQVLTGAAVVLVEPLTKRLEEVERRATAAERRATAAERALNRLRATMTAWSYAVLAPDATLDQVRDLIRRQPIP